MMNKPYLLLFLFLCLAGLNACTGRTGENSGNNPVSSADTSNSAPVISKAGQWVQKGVECYGIVIVNFNDGKTIGKAVKCKVMSVRPDKVKMKTIESVSLMESVGCDKLGLAYGDTWWETEGDIYKTRDEADKILIEKGWLVK